MRSLKSAEIKKILLGIIATDGCVVGGRFDLFTKSEEYAKYVVGVLNQITRTKATYYLKKDKRNVNYSGYRVYTNTNPYFKKLEKLFYKDRKILSEYVCSRLSLQSIAHMWICDGSLEHNINRRRGTVQNIGWFCLLKYNKNELSLFVERLNYFGINSRIIYKSSAGGFKYFVRISGMELQKFISAVYPFILNDYKYKTDLYYMTLSKVDTELSNTEHFIKFYNKVEDIVRHSW